MHKEEGKRLSRAYQDLLPRKNTGGEGVVRLKMWRENPPVGGNYLGGEQGPEWGGGPLRNLVKESNKFGGAKLTPFL